MFDQAYTEEDKMICWIDDNRVVAVEAGCNGIYAEFANEGYSCKWVIDESHDIEERYGNDLHNAEYMSARAVRDLQYMLSEYRDQTWNDGDKIPTDEIPFILSINA